MILHVVGDPIKSQSPTLVGNGKPKRSWDVVELLTSEKGVASHDALVPEVNDTFPNWVELYDATACAWQPAVVSWLKQEEGWSSGNNLLRRQKQHDDRE